MGRNKYPEETVAKILDAALELFCVQGYEGTSIQDIAFHSGFLIIFHYKINNPFITRISSSSIKSI